MEHYQNNTCNTLWILPSWYTCDIMKFHACFGGNSGKTRNLQLTMEKEDMARGEIVQALRVWLSYHSCLIFSAILLREITHIPSTWCRELRKGYDSWIRNEKPCQWKIQVVSHSILFAIISLLGYNLYLPWAWFHTLLPEGEVVVFSTPTKINVGESIHCTEKFTAYLQNSASVLIVG